MLRTGSIQPVKTNYACVCAYVCAIVVMSLVCTHMCARLLMCSMYDV